MPTNAVMSSVQMNRGSCLCGDLVWEIEGAPVFMADCHCSMCRKLHGAAFVTFVAVPPNRFRWASGESRPRAYASSPGARRWFCRRCGSSTPPGEVHPASEAVFIPAGNMAGDPGRRRDFHAFAGSKAPWFEITDGLPQFDTYPDDMAFEAIDDAPRPPPTSGWIGGSCQCGAVAFEFSETTGRMGFCHCSRCRRARSAAYSAQTFVAAAAFRWLRGEDALARFRPPGARHFVQAFCPACGSPMPTEDRALDLVLVPAGALDQDPRVRPQAHIFVANKAPWITVTDGLPQFAAGPEGAEVQRLGTP